MIDWKLITEKYKSIDWKMIKFIVGLILCYIYPMILIGHFNFLYLVSITIGILAFISLVIDGNEVEKMDEKA